MGNSPVDRNTNIMREVWGTTSLTSDYWSLPKQTNDPEELVLQEVTSDYWSLPHETNDNVEERVIQEIMHDDLEKGQKNLQE